LTPNFSTSQPSGDLSSFIITDTSTSPDGSVTGRLITLRKYNGDYLTPDNYTTTYIFWPIDSNSLTVTDILDKDYAVEITVNWYVGSTSQYTKVILTGFTGYGDLFLRQLTQALAANRTTISARNFWENKNKLRVLLDDAAQAISLLNDQTIAQFCLDKSKELTDNPSNFF